MSELLGLAAPPAQGAVPSAQAMPKAESMQSKLIKADYNGSIMSGQFKRYPFLEGYHIPNLELLAVARAKNPCLVGLSGIVIHETENAFRVVTEKNQIKGTFFPLYPPNVMDLSQSLSFASK